MARKPGKPAILTSGANVTFKVRGIGVWVFVTNPYDATVIPPVAYSQTVGQITILGELYGAGAPFFTVTGQWFYFPGDSSGHVEEAIYTIINDDTAGAVAVFFEPYDDESGLEYQQ